MLRIAPFLFLLLIHTSNTFAQSPCYGLMWSDEFDGNSLNLDNWNYDLGNGCPNLCGWGNGELESYTNSEENVRVSNGILTIEAKRDGDQYTSGKIHTRNKHAWTYGRFEARMRMPKGRGAWPAFWMLRPNTQWPLTGEIDIMEYRGDHSDNIEGTLHYGNPYPNNQWDGNSFNNGTDFSEDFHVYAVEWDENSISWYVDDNLFKVETKDPNTLNPQSGTDPWPWDTDFYIILNLAVGGWFTGTTNINDVNLSKATFEIDYVRAYGDQAAVGTQEPYAETPAAVPGRIDLEHYDVACAGVSYYDIDGANRGGELRMDAVDIQETTDQGGGYNLGWTETGEWTEYTINVEDAGTYEMDIRAASDNASGAVSFMIDDQTLIGNLNIDGTGGWQSWETTTSGEFQLTEGEHVLRMTIEEGGLNLNYIDFIYLDVVATKNQILEYGLNIYPNPVKETFAIEFSKGDFDSGTIVDQYGVTRKSFLLSGNSDNVNLKGLESGSYFLRLNNSDGDHVTAPILKF